MIGTLFVKGTFRDHFNFIMRLGTGRVICWVSLIIEGSGLLFYAGFMKFPVFNMKFLVFGRVIRSTKTLSTKVSLTGTVAKTFDKQVSL